MFDHNYAPSTVNTYVCAIGYSHKLAGYDDPTKVFFVSQMLKGYGKIGFRLDSRLPITLPILQQLICAAPVITDTQHEARLFKAMCSLAFFAFLRVGEMTDTGHSSNSTLQISQLSKLCNSAGVVMAFKLTFTEYKHNYNQRPFSLIIERQQPLCPVELMLDYLTYRGLDSGPLFLSTNGCGMPRQRFVSLLSFAVKHCGLNPSFYKGHSFRIGAASHAAHRGFADAQIRIMGRWKSNAFQKYIRVSSLSSK